MRKLDEETYNMYKKLGSEDWGKDLTLWKMMYLGFVEQNKEEDFTPFTKLFFNMFLDLPKNRKAGISASRHGTRGPARDSEGLYRC